MSVPHAPSMPAGSHEMRDYYSNQDPPRSAPHTAPSITPYLGLRARLSQVWINRWTIILLLVLVRTLIAIASIDNGISSARREALSACTDVEAMGSTMASMPHYMSQGVNELTAKGVEKAVDGLMDMAGMSITGAGEIVIFVIGMMTNTYTCLATMAIHGSLEGVVSVLDASQKDIDQLTKSVTGDLGSSLKKFSDAYDATKKVIEGITFLDKSVDPPDFPDTQALQKQLTSFKLPDLAEPFKKLNQTIPNFDGVKNLTEGLIRTPFNLAKDEMDKFMGNYTFDRSLLPVPAKEKLNFCSDGDEVDKFFDNLQRIADMFRKIFLSVLIAGAILAIIPMGYREVRRYRKQKQRMPLVMSAANDPMDVTYLVQRPYTSSFGLWLSKTPPNQISSASRRQQLLRWAVAYATTDAALFVLTVALTGFLACLCQIILLRVITKETSNLDDQVGAFAEKVINQLENASSQWQSGVNKAIQHESDFINDKMLGWVNITTGAVNGTINTFVNETSQALDLIFGNSPLKTAVKDVLDCLVLLKVAGVQKALTWVSDHAHVEFPMLPNDTFTLGAALSLGKDEPADESFFSNPGDIAKDKVSSVVERLIRSIESGIRTEAIISSVVLAAWLALLIGGFIYAAVQMMGSDKTRGMGGAPPTQDAPYRPDYPHSVMSMPHNDFTSDHPNRFVDVPLRPVDNSRHFDAATAPPLPAYKEREVSPVRPARRHHEKNPFEDRSEVSAEDDYQDKNLGFARSKE